MVAVVTVLEMAAENSSPADLDRGHGAALRHRERSAMLLTIGFAVAAKHIRHFELRAIHVPELEVLWWSGLGLSDNRLREQIEWAGGGAHLGSGDAQIAGRGSQAAMTKQQLNGAHVGAGFQQMDREGVAAMPRPGLCRVVTSQPRLTGLSAISMRHRRRSLQLSCSGIAGFAQSSRSCGNSR